MRSRPIEHAKKGGEYQKGWDSESLRRARVDAYTRTCLDFGKLEPLPDSTCVTSIPECYTPVVQSSAGHSVLPSGMAKLEIDSDQLLSSGWYSRFSLASLYIRPC